MAPFGSRRAFVTLDGGIVHHAAQTYGVDPTGGRRMIVGSDAATGPLPDACSASRILVVDDDPAIREILAELLADEGYRVDTAKNGADALGVLREGGSFCVVLLDLMMPVMDGWEFRQAQKADPELDGIPVIVFSGTDNLARQVHDLSVAEYLEKPIDAERLLACIGQYCRTDGASAAQSA
jgi:CheY-like chemotaxis protein